MELADDEAENENENGNGGNDDLEGVVFKVDSSSQFEIVVLDGMANIANVSAGNPVTVTLSTGGASLRVGPTASTCHRLCSLRSKAPLTLPNSTGTRVNPQPLDEWRAGGGNHTITTIASAFAWRVSRQPSPAHRQEQTSTSKICPDSLAGIQTVGATSPENFNNVAGVRSLTDGTSVSLRGLLFAGSPSLTLIADKVIKR